MPELEQIATASSLTEQAHERIRRYILSGQRAPAERLTEEFFSQQLGISKSPVREAMNSLQKEGLLRIEPRRGAFVPVFTPREVRDLYGLREALEVFATQSAEITPRLVSDLRVSVQRTTVSLRNGDRDAHIAEDAAFHSRIVQAAANDELCRVHENIQDKLWLCRCQTFQLTSPETPAAHAEILKALASGDRDEAVEATRRHIRFVCEALLRVMG